jgi:peptide deformylase
MDALRYDPDPILHYECTPITLFNGKLENLANRMFDAMYHYDGVGLAAPQIGYSLQIFVYDDREGHSGAIVNPRIEHSQWFEIIMPVEGCLSLPAYTMRVARFTPVNITGYNIFGEKISFEARDLLAQIVQHECDHLGGLLITDQGIGF